MEERIGFEPTIEELQSTALPDLATAPVYINYI